MDKRRVLLLCSQSLLGEGLERILCELEDVELIGPWVVGSQVLSHLIETVPDVVVVAEGERAEGESAATLTTQILERYPDLPVVRIGLKQNALRIYTSRTLPARSAELIEAIRGLPIQPHKGEVGSQP